MSYKLKPGSEEFVIMSGPDEGKKFVKKLTYDQVPEGYENRFESAGQASAPAEKTAPVGQKVGRVSKPDIKPDTENKQAKA
jgi:hypothetical protein